MNKEKLKPQIGKGLTGTVRGNSAMEEENGDGKAVSPVNSVTGKCKNGRNAFIFRKPNKTLK